MSEHVNEYKKLKEAARNAGGDFFTIKEALPDRSINIMLKTYDATGRCTGQKLLPDPRRSNKKAARLVEKLIFSSVVPGANWYIFMMPEHILKAAKLDWIMKGENHGYCEKEE